ncbi:MAG: GTPase domain-containing protein [Polyangiaceae bacterium]
MAFYDRRAASIVIRVVYDGMGTAGKTTNIDKIWELFSVAREGDVYTPETLRGRTLYFDWLELNAGRIADRRLRCQIITVPGQFAYVQRRWELLRYPDAIVAVCDSTRESLTRARLGFQFLRRTLAVREMHNVPIVLQANKQDLPDAIPVDELREHLATGDDVRIVAASALDGTGVRRTLMDAIHAASERLRAKLDDMKPHELEPYGEGPEELYLRLKSYEDSGALDEGAAIADKILAEAELAS